MAQFFIYLFEFFKIVCNACNLVLSYIYNDNIKIFGTPLYIILYVIMLGKVVLEHFDFTYSDVEDGAE